MTECLTQDLLISTTSPQICDMVEFIRLFGLVCERALAVSFTCKPRPGEVAVGFC